MAFSPKKHYFLDLLLFILFILSAFSGMVLGFISRHGGAYRGFAQGDGGGPYSSCAYAVLNLSRYAWKTLHTWSSFLLVFLVLIHLLVHRQWIVSMTKKIFTSKR